MASATGEEVFEGYCPHLGLADDADSHATYATDAHRCFRLERPTRIASNHQERYCLGPAHTTCPIFKGEGIGGPAPAAAPPPAREQPVRPNLRPRGGAPRPTTSSPKTGSVGPRPRPGGISLPVATIGLFVLAGVVVAIAFFIQSVVGDDDDGSISQADLFNTQQAIRSLTPGANSSPGATRTGTPGTGTPATGTPRTGTPTTGTPGTGTGSNTYTVQSGDTCAAIAAEHNTTFDQLRQLNPEINADCTNLQVGQVIKVP